MAWETPLAGVDDLATGMVNGSPVAREGRKVRKSMMLVSKADDEAGCNAFGLPHFSAEECCPECLANRDLAERPFSELKAGAAWRPTKDIFLSCTTCGSGNHHTD